MLGWRTACVASLSLAVDGAHSSLPRSQLQCAETRSAQALETIAHRHDRIAAWEYVAFMSDPVELPGYRFLGWGPSATSGGAGWHLASDYFGRCGACGSMLRLWADASEQCSCGRLYKDVDAGRFGSKDGDSNIAVYRKLP